MSKNINDILSLFKSRVDVAKASGMTSASSVDSWVARGKIPHDKRVLMLRNCGMVDVSQDALFKLLMVDYYNVLEKR